MRAIEQKRTLQQPRSEQQILAELQDAHKEAQAVFREAFRRQDGSEYAESQTFLAGANEQIKRLRRKVKGY